MRTAALALLLALAGVFATEPAQAHGRARVHFGFHFGAPLYWGPYWGPWWYYPPPPPPVYYYPPPPAPITYIERETPAPSSTPEWWYYCHDPRGYYPHVEACPGGWQKVPPGPPPAR